MYFQNRAARPQAPPNYKLYEQIGSGQFSTVYRCIHIPTSQVYAIKCIPKYHFQQIPQLLQLLQTELRLLRQLQHPNVIKLIDQYEDYSIFYIIYEYCPDGTLSSLFQRNRIEKIPASLSREFIKQMVSALLCLHQHSLLHRDIKPANILLCENGKVTKLSDFGFCKQTNLTHTQLGTPGYMAPEMLNGRPYDQKADVYSLGVCVLQLIQNSERDNKLQLLLQISQQMVERDPRKRPTIQQVNQMLEKTESRFGKDERQVRQIRSRSQPCKQQEQQIKNVYIKQQEVKQKRCAVKYNCQNKENYPPQMQQCEKKYNEFQPQYKRHLATKQLFKRDKNDLKNLIEELDYYKQKYYNCNRKYR